jgi:hypothetical protein
MLILACPNFTPLLKPVRSNLSSRGWHPWWGQRAWRCAALPVRRLVWGGACRRARRGRARAGERERPNGDGAIASVWVQLFLTSGGMLHIRPIFTDNSDKSRSTGEPNIWKVEWSHSILASSWIKQSPNCDMNATKLLLNWWCGYWLKIGRPNPMLICFF